MGKSLIGSVCFKSKEFFKKKYSSLKTFKVLSDESFTNLSKNKEIDQEFYFDFKNSKRYSFDRQKFRKIKKRVVKLFKKYIKPKKFKIVSRLHKKLMRYVSFEEKTLKDKLLDLTVYKGENNIIYQRSVTEITKKTSNMNIIDLRFLRNKSIKEIQQQTKLSK